MAMNTSSMSLLTNRQSIRHHYYVQAGWNARPAKPFNRFVSIFISNIDLLRIHSIFSHFLRTQSMTNARPLELGCFADSMVGPDIAVLLSWFLLKIRSVTGCDRMLGAILFSRRRSTHPESWLHLSFRVHWPYRYRRDNRGCPGLML